MSWTFKVAVISFTKAFMELFSTNANNWNKLVMIRNRWPFSFKTVSTGSPIGSRLSLDINPYRFCISITFEITGASIATLHQSLKVCSSLTFWEHEIVEDWNPTGRMLNRTFKSFKQLKNFKHLWKQTNKHFQ